MKKKVGPYKRKGKLVRGYERTVSNEIPPPMKPAEFKELLHNLLDEDQNEADARHQAIVDSLDPDIF